MKPKSNAQSSTVFPSGPGLSSEDPMATMPDLLTLPYVGFNPTQPHQFAGTRIEPAVSEPIAIRHISAETAAALPPEDPPGEYSGFFGFRVVPQSDDSVLLPCA